MVREWTDSRIGAIVGRASDSYHNWDELTIGNGWNR